MQEIFGKWPYPVRYDVESEVSCDVLVLGGGVAGCFAAIAAANKGANVILVDKGPIKTSGAGGAGCDHWNYPLTGPFCNVTPEALIDVVDTITMGWYNGIQFYIQCKESYDCLLDVEKWGLPLRDVDDEFKGASFRDEESKLLFAYNYDNKHIVRVRGGARIKEYYYNELNRLGVPMYERVMATSLLTEDGEEGSKIVGATGLNSRTGEFYTFKAKSTVLCMSLASSPWIFSTEIMGAAINPLDPNCTGEGFSMAWDAGAEFALMERSMPNPGQYQAPWLGTGFMDKTWHACTIVDSNGKEVPWVNHQFNEIESVEDRYHNAPGQTLTIIGLPIFPSKLKQEMLYPMTTFNIKKMLKSGELTLPLYADLAGMPEDERRAIWGLMVGNEGKTRVPIYENYCRWGFDPDQDMLAVPVHPSDWYMAPAWMFSKPPDRYRGPGIMGGGLVFDWDLKTNLAGLYVAGMNGFCGLDHSQAACTGRYAGRRAADYALEEAPDPIIDRDQVELEKTKVYGPVNRDDGIGWKEVHAGICDVMQEFCGVEKHESTLNIGLRWLKEIKEVEVQDLYARNPHELARCMEAFTLITVGEITMQASLARKASLGPLDFHRLDYPKADPEYNKFVTVRKNGDQVKVGELPHRYWLREPYAASYEENYQRHCGLD
jgi:succinate dehydrogenase/fumarate reductase flavoprotein subunit